MKRKRKGFTLIEVTLAILLISILIGITTPLVSNVVSRADLNAAHESLYNSILRAQNLSKIQYRNQQWRVCIDNTAKQYIIAAGTCSSPLYAETIKFSSNITVSSTQTLDLQFTSPKGELNYAGNFSKISLNGGGVSKSIIVNQNGVIDKAATSDPSNTTFTPSIVTDGLVLHLDSGNIGSYPGSGNTWFDLSGNGNNGELVSSPIYNFDNPNLKFFQFVNDDFIRIQNNTSLDTQTPSVEVWVKTNSTSQNGFWFEKGNVNTQYSLFQESSFIQWRQYFSSGQGLTNLSTTTATYMNTTSWYQVIGTYTSGTRRLYINGVQVNSDTQIGTIATNSGGMSIGVYGGYSGGRGYYYNGNLSICRVYNRALTPAEIQQNFNATKGRFGL